MTNEERNIAIADMRRMKNEYMNGRKIDEVAERKCKSFDVAIKALEQQPCRDMEEIREVMSCDADAETKCKMISYILTAKPHYFEKQTVQDKQAESEKYQKAFDDGYANGYAQAKFDYEQDPCEKCNYVEGSPFCLKYCPYDTERKKEQEPCEDAVVDELVSREAVMRLIENKPYDWSNLTERHNMLMEIRKLPSVTRQTGEWVGIDEEPHEDYECSICGYVCSTFTANIEPQDEYKYCPNCGAKMQEVKE